MTLLDKSTYDAQTPLESNEGQRVLLSSDRASSRCPSLDLSVENVQQQMIQKGYSSEAVESMTAYIRGIAHEIVIRTLNKKIPYEE